MLVSPPLGVQAAHGAQERKTAREAQGKRERGLERRKTSEGILTSLRLSFARQLPVEGSLFPGEASCSRGCLRLISNPFSCVRANRRTHKQCMVVQLTRAHKFPYVCLTRRVSTKALGEVTCTGAAHEFRARSEVTCMGAGP